ncbi:MAG: O-antigen ligase family protein [Candidatus Eiseniibacteriota bacterium]
MPELVIFWPLVAVTLLSPVPFGSVQPWAWGLLGIVTGLAMAGWCAAAWLNREMVAMPVRRFWVAALLFALAMIWAALQAASWTPDVWHHPIWGEAAKALGTAVPGSVAIDDYATGSTMMRLLTYAGIFWITLQFARNRITARRLIYALLIAEAVFAVYGLIVKFSGSETILWYAKQFYRGDVTSTFVNRNSYATFAGIGLITATAVIAHRILSLEFGISRRETIRTLIRALAEREWIVIVLWFIMLTALVLTSSRAGVASAFVGLGAFLLLLGRSHAVPRWAARTMGGAVVAAVLLLLVVSGGTLDKRFYTSVGDGPAPIRPELYELTFNAIKDSPYLGFGLGSFPDVFTLYRTDSHTMMTRSIMAHNTYLENALELGIPAAAILCLAIALIAGQCFLGVGRRRRDFVYPALGFAVSVQVAVHSLADFSLQIPAVAATYALVLGLGFAQSWSSDVPPSRAYE